MPNTNAIVPFATGPGANVLSPAAYAALAARQVGFVAGVATSAQVNTAIRQPAFVATVIAQFTADYGPANVNDDGNVAEMEAQFVAALRVAAGVSTLGALLFEEDSGTANNIVITPATPLPGYSAGNPYLVLLANAITGASTINISGLGARSLTRLGGAPTQQGDGAAGDILIVCDTGSGYQILGTSPADIQNGAWVSAVDNGTANAMVITLSPAVAALKKFQRFRIQKSGNPNNAAVTLAVNAIAPAPVIWPDGSPLIQNDLPANCLFDVMCDGANFVLQSIGGPSVFQRAGTARSANGQCHFSLTSSTLANLAPKNGNSVVVNGAQVLLPSGGVSASNTGVYVNGTPGQALAASTLYYVSLAVISTVLTLRFWAVGTYGHMPDTTAGNIGIEVISNAGAPVTTDTLVGKILTTAGGQFQDTNGAIGLLSWFNRLPKQSRTSFSTAQATTSAGTFVEFNSQIRSTFINWGDEPIEYGIVGSVFTQLPGGTADGTANVGCAFDGTTVEQEFVSTSMWATSGPFLSANISYFLAKAGLSEASSHFVTMVGMLGGGLVSATVFQMPYVTYPGVELVVIVRG